MATKTRQEVTDEITEAERRAREALRRAADEAETIRRQLKESELRMAAIKKILRKAGYQT